MMTTLMETINDISSDNGIIKSLESNNAFDFITTTYPNFDFKVFEYDYYLGHSGDKYISILYERLNELDDTNVLTNLAKIIKQRFYTNWKLKWEAYHTSYKPLENYSMVEEENIGSKLTTKTDGTTSHYSFDNGASPTDDNDIEVVSEGAYNDNHRKLTRDGNIGVTTSQQMLQSELDLRVNDLLNDIMNDIDSVICIQGY